MPELSRAEAIRRAYLEPIRTVILVDDEFPSYDGFAPVPPAAPAETEAATQPAPAGDAAPTTAPPACEGLNQTTIPAAPPALGPARDYERARSLWKACRSLGYLCDVDNGSGIGPEIPPHIDKSDLVILDYHLQGQDPSIALRVLRHLAQSEHASRVVVYTRDTSLDDVRRRVAAHLRGARRPDSILSAEDLDLWEGLEDWSPAPSGTTIDAFLRGDRKAACSDAELRGQLEQRGVDRGRCSALIEAAIESFLADAYRLEPEVADRLPSIEMNATEGPSRWVRADNLFVAFVQKTAENASQGEQVFGALEQALKDWNPPYLPTVLSYARGVVSRGGFRMEERTLSDPLLQAGWLYHSVSGAEPERPDRLRGLFDRLLSTQVGAILDEIADFGRASFPDYEAGIDALEWAKGIVPAAAGKADWHIFHSLNRFLATEPIGSFVRTGTVFQPETQETGREVAWICVTPACDLVPHLLHPTQDDAEFHTALDEFLDQRGSLAIKASAVLRRNLRALAGFRPQQGLKLRLPPLQFLIEVGLMPGKRGLRCLFWGAWTDPLNSVLPVPRYVVTDGSQRVVSVPVFPVREFQLAEFRRTRRRPEFGPLFADLFQTVFERDQRTSIVPGGDLT